MGARLLLLAVTVAGGCASQAEWRDLRWETPSGEPSRLSPMEFFEWLVAGLDLPQNPPETDQHFPGVYTATGPDYERNIEAARRAEVLLPQETPYDYDPEARRSYLGRYEAGYRCGLAGFLISISFASDLLSRAADAGWRDGYDAGWERHFAEVEREMKGLWEFVGPFHEADTVEPSDGSDAAGDSEGRGE